MNNLIKLIPVFTLLVFLSACGDEKKSVSNNKEELIDLKKRQKELQDKIATLEAMNPKKDSMRKIPVVISSMTPSIFNNYVDVQGKIDLDEVVNAIPEAPGIIESIRVRPGQYVRKGQVVATLRSESVDKGIVELDHQIQFAKTLYDKQKRLWDEEIGTEIQLLGAKNNYESLLKRKQTTQTQKTSFNVYSPINGVVDAVDATVGQSFASMVSGFPIIRIINTGKLKVKAGIPENYSSVVRTGSRCMVVFPDVHDSLMTNVNYVEKMIDPITRTYTAYIPLPANSKYQPNMTAHVKIVTYQNNRAFVLPMALIQKTDNGNFIFIADDKNKAKLTPVTLGNSYQSKVEILSGLSLGEKVITVGYEELNEGDDLSIN